MVKPPRLSPPLDHLNYRVPRYSFRIDIIRLRFVGLRLRRRTLSLLLQLLRLSQLLPCHNLLILGDDLLSISRHLVALLWLRPESRDGETVVEVCSEIVHDANGKHDIHAELHRIFISFRQGDREYGKLTLKASRLRPPILSNLVFRSRTDIQFIVGVLCNCSERCEGLAE